MKHLFGKLLNFLFPPKPPTMVRCGICEELTEPMGYGICEPCLKVLEDETPEAKDRLYERMLHGQNLIEQRYQAHERNK